MKTGSEQWRACRVAACAAVKHSGYEVIRQIGAHQHPAGTARLLACLEASQNSARLRMKRGLTVTSRRKVKRDTGRAVTAPTIRSWTTPSGTFTGSEYDAKTGEWRMSKLPVHHILQWAM
jgi:hypothetical protein